MALDTTDMATTGVESREHGSDALKALWAKADEMNAAEPGVWNGGTRRGEYVPWQAIEIDMSIMPRTALNQQKVAEYADILDQMPPLLVQRNTLKLVDGRNRLEAASRAGIDLVRVDYTDKEGDELIDLAFEMNRDHGIPLSLEERRAAARRKLQRNPEWTQAEIAKWAGLSDRTVYTIVHENDPVEVPTPRSTRTTRAKQAEAAKAAAAAPPPPVTGAAPKRKAPLTHASPSNGTAVPKPMAQPYQWQSYIIEGITMSPRLLLGTKIKRSEWGRVSDILSELHEDFERWYKEWYEVAGEMGFIADGADGAEPASEATGDVDSGEPAQSEA
jgi:ParB-like chromosome segregation protein Spo0J